MSQDKTPALDACPFCGSEQISLNRATGFFYAQCTDCFSRSESCSDKASAVYAWNRRNPPEAAHLERTGQSVTNDARIDAARLDGLKAGWNFAIAGQDAKYDAAVLALGDSVTTLRKEARATPPEAATAEAAGKAPVSVPSAAELLAIMEARRICVEPTYEEAGWEARIYEDDETCENRVGHGDTVRAAVLDAIKNHPVAALAAQPRSTT